MSRDRFLVCAQDPVLMSSLNEDINGLVFQVCTFGRITKILVDRFRVEKDLNESGAGDKLTL